MTWGSAQFGPATGGNQRPQGRALVAQLGDNQFLVAGYFCTVDFFPAGSEPQRKSQHIVEGTGQIPSALIDGKWQHRQFLRVEQGVYDNGVFKLLGSQNGDATDYGLKFGKGPWCCASRWPPISLNPAVESLAAQIRPLFASDPTAPQFTVMVTSIGLACHCGHRRWRVAAQGTAGF